MIDPITRPTEVADATSDGRRPIKARGSRWAAAVTDWLVAVKVSPNAISLGSVAFAGGACACFVASSMVMSWGLQSLLLIAAALCIQSRLLCNLFDGMVAVEGKMGGKRGEIYNDLPDRPADVLILIGAGYAARSLHPSWHAIELGWLAGVMALMTAYVRVLGKSVGAKIYFIGPMAKQHRMAVLTVACVIAAAAAAVDRAAIVLWSALAIIVLGSVITVARRLHKIFADMEAR